MLFRFSICVADVYVKEIIDPCHAFWGINGVLLVEKCTGCARHIS